MGDVMSSYLTPEKPTKSRAVLAPRERAFTREVLQASAKPYVLKRYHGGGEGNVFAAAKGRKQKRPTLAERA